MEAFFVSYTPITAITIFSGLYKRVLEREWAGDRKEEIENFVKSQERSLDNILTDEGNEERVMQLRSFGTGEELKRRRAGSIISPVPIHLAVTQQLGFTAIVADKDFYQIFETAIVIFDDLFSYILEIID
ncbi:17117_t:CDS:2 [Cetraspora pellucida]|uniref:17117_t:CDS:1 n=1 Tax=Cetraspora pellucida TaxID=1433469 RepID=A0A9N9C498_9GLOM|nr:17117_t:CDS:2 [Cetraspora pellucida]